MKLTQTRRVFLLGAFSALTTECAPSANPPTTTSAVDRPRSLSEIEAGLGGRLGVFAVDTGTGRQLAHRSDERFAMCSTFKWVLAAAVLALVDRRVLSLDELVTYGSCDLLDHAPVTAQHAAEGALTVEALSEAIITVSDNTAANLLLAKLGGPAVLTQFIRANGDSITRLDRIEPGLNANDPDDPRDTTSPRAMVALMRRVLCSADVLLPPSRERLLRWLRASATGKNRLRAGFPSDWIVGDKTGTGQRNAVNDVAIAAPPEHAPVLVAVYTTGSVSDLKAIEAAHAEVGWLVAQAI